VCLLVLCGFWGAAGIALDIVGPDGKHATIVLPDKPVVVEEYAAEELQYHIRESTAVTLPIVKESQAPTGSGRMYLGACQATRKAGITTDALAPNACIIRLIGDDLFLVGDSHGQVFTEGWSTNIIPTHIGTLFAVYEFLEKQLGVKWLWPGKSGEIIPKRTHISVQNWDETWTPPFIFTRVRDHVIYNRAEAEKWSSPEAFTAYRRNQAVWLRRQRFAMGVNLELPETFAHYWERFGQTNPEFFNLLPDGTRRSDPTVYDGAPNHLSMCVSQPGLWKKVVEEWAASHGPGTPIQAGECDNPGKCTCPACLAWDVPDPTSKVPFAERLALAKAAFAKGDPGWVRNLGSLADRYAKFYLAVQKEAEKIDPAATVLGLAYENYVAAPLQTTLNPRVVSVFVTSFSFPWTQEKRDQARAGWDGWHQAGASLLLRPNYFLEGHNLPLFFARKFGADFSYAASHGLIATDFDSLTGQFATQGPNLYVLARVHTEPGRPVDDILEEYYSGFGPAKDAVRSYFRHWEAVADAVTDDAFNAAMARTGGNAWWGFFIVADSIFTPAVMGKGRELLTAAQQMAAGDSLTEERVAFLERGLRHAELTLGAQAAFREHKQGGDFKTFADAVRELDRYRQSLDVNTDNVSFPYWAETLGGWDRKRIYP
jgi:hypothetical protein